MIWNLIFVPIKLLLQLIISLIPGIPTMAYDMSELIVFIKRGLYFTNVNIFFLCISIYIAMELALLAWGITKFIYQKIPFISIR